MTTIILGGGIAALSLASMLEDDSVILEKEKAFGGLCRSFDFNGLVYDIGPHIIFSKHQDVLNLHNSMVEVNTLKRLNKILLNGKYIPYPFENFLGELENQDKEIALSEFLNNPYRGLPVSSMQQFFLEKFGEGMTDLYFGPYNKKIWKLDPSFLDLQMVERIPSPPIEDVIAGAEGNPREGYVHQLFFTYPSHGGFQSIIDSYVDKLKLKGDKLYSNTEVTNVVKNNDGWTVQTSQGDFKGDRLVSTIPLSNLANLVEPDNTDIINASNSMMYNSIHIVILKIKGDRLQDQFALYVPDSEVIFHRLSRLNFLGEEYGLGSDTLNLMAEITFRPDSFISTLDSDQILSRTIAGLDKLGIAMETEILEAEVKTFEYAYVIYDLLHRERTDLLLNWANNLDITCHGRFGKFEYQNSDQVVADSFHLADRLNASN
jgi:protoporphyrinogen oxidase